MCEMTKNGFPKDCELCKTAFFETHSLCELKANMPEKELKLCECCQVLEATEELESDGHFGPPEVSHVCGECYSDIKDREIERQCIKNI